MVYLNWIRQVLGEAVYQQLLPNVLNFEKVFTLQEQYLYGSKRLGVRRPKLQLATAPHLLEVCALELLQEPLLPVKRANYFRSRESETIQKSTECVAFPQRSTASGCAKSEIQIRNQKSEINQVLDRKTGVKASPTATTYAWFKADVASAQDYYPFGSLLPGRTYTAAAGEGYRFGFNGMQRDDEVKGPGNSLDFGARMYDSRLGRWMSVDPLESKFPDIGSYTFVKNNPSIYVDLDGKENVIYLVYLPSSKGAISIENAQSMVDEANKNFERLGLKTTVVLVNQSEGQNRRFDPCLIDKTDAVAVMGSTEKVIEWITNNDQKFGEELKRDWSGGNRNPEHSQNNGESLTGKYIALDAFGLEGFGQNVLNGASQEKTGALAINHGAGHNASINHAYDGSKRQSFSVIMSTANRLHKLLSNPKSGFPNYNDLISNELDVTGKPRNEDYVNRMKDRFGNNDANATYKPE